MSIEGQAQQTRTVTYADVHVLNSSGNILLEVKRETLDANNQRVAISDGARVMINDGVYVDPATRMDVTGQKDAEGNQIGTPALSYFMSQFGSQWAEIAAFIEAFLSANGHV